MGSSVTEPGASFGLRVSPNPASDYAFLMPDRDLEVQVGIVTLFDWRGARVRKQAFAVYNGEPVRLSLNGLRPGTYACRVLTERGEIGLGKVVAAPIAY
jgi:hypothetical protein